jgi:hypothetical protein
MGLSIWASFGHVWAILHLGGKPNPTLECMDAGRMGVRPIFYKVDPGDVRHLKGAFADAFAKHVLAIFKENVEKKVQRWRDALRRVAGLSGHHLKNE